MNVPHSGVPCLGYCKSNIPDRGTRATNKSINLELSFSKVCAPLMGSVPKLDTIYDLLRFFGCEMKTISRMCPI